MHSTLLFPDYTLYVHVYRVRVLLYYLKITCISFKVNWNAFSRRWSTLSHLQSIQSQFQHEQLPMSNRARPCSAHRPSVPTGGNPSFATRQDRQNQISVACITRKRGGSTLALDCLSERWNSHRVSEKHVRSQIIKNIFLIYDIFRSDPQVGFNIRFTCNCSTQNRLIGRALRIALQRELDKLWRLEFLDAPVAKSTHFLMPSTSNNFGCNFRLAQRKLTFRNRQVMMWPRAWSGVRRTGSKFDPRECWWERNRVSDEKLDHTINIWYIPVNRVK